MSQATHASSDRIHDLGVAVVRPRIGVSACVLGESVRHDGGHCRQRFLTDVLGPFVEWEPVCPEVSAGMGAPREAVRLVEVAGALRLVGSRSGTPWTAPVEAAATRCADRLAEARVHGIVLRRNSPTCGVGSARVYHENGHRKGSSDGLFARELRTRFPLLAVEEDGRLNDDVLRQRFLTRTFTAARWGEALRSASPRALVAFHARHKMQLTAHQPESARRLGQIVGIAGAPERLDRLRDRVEVPSWSLAAATVDDPAHPFARLLVVYEAELAACVHRHPTRGRQVNVIQHLAGFVKRQTTRAEVRELERLVRDYVAELVPLAVPVTLLSHFLARYDAPAWVREQTWLEPFPRGLGVQRL